MMFAKLGFSFALINLSLYRFCSFWNITLCHNVLKVHHFFFYSRDHSLIFSTLAVFARFSKQYWNCLNCGETKSYTEYTSQYDMIICQELNAIVSIVVTSNGLCDWTFISQLTVFFGKIMKSLRCCAHLADMGYCGKAIVSTAEEILKSTNFYFLIEEDERRGWKLMDWVAPLCFHLYLS